MALYDPIREGFREFNKMLIDSQTWDEHNDAKEANRIYQHSVLESNLVQRAFENQMARQRHTLAVNNDVRAQTALDETLRMNKANLKIRQDEFKLKVNDDLRRGEAAKRADEQHKMNRDMHVFEMDEARGKANDATLKWDPQPVDLNGLIPNHLRDDEVFMTRANELLGPMDAFMDKDMKVVKYTKDGMAPLNLSPMQMSEFTPALEGLVAEFNDPVKNAHANIEALTAQRAAVKEQMPKGNDNYNFEDRAYAKAELSSIDGKIDEQRKQFEPATAKEQLAARALDSSKAANWYYGKGLVKLGDMARENFQTLRDAALAADNTDKGQTTQLWERELNSKGRAVPAGQWIFGPKSMDYRQLKEDGSVDIMNNPASRGLTASKPTENFVKAGSGSGSGGKMTGFMTEAQMKAGIADSLSIENALGKMILADRNKKKSISLQGVASRRTRQLAKEKELPLDQVRELAQTEAMELGARIDEEYFKLPAKIMAMPDKTVNNMIKKKFPKYNGPPSTEGKRKFLQQKAKEGYWVRQDLIKFTGDKNVPMYIPNREVMENTMGQNFNYGLGG